jgi:hypothetical protein
MRMVRQSLQSVGLAALANTTLVGRRRSPEHSDDDHAPASSAPDSDTGSSTPQTGENPPSPENKE